MTKRLIVTKTAWGGHQIEVYLGGAFIRVYRTTFRLSRYSDEYIDKLAKLLEIPKKLIDRAVQLTLKNTVKKTVQYREDLGICSCGCEEHMQKKGKRFLPNHYNLLVKKLRDNLKKNNKEDREWALDKMKELNFTERNLYVGGKLPKGVKL